jgi:phosphatidylglycerophosphatase A
VKGGFGVMIDDAIAGMFAAIVLAALLWALR